MDKQLHLYILDVLQQGNAIGKMVDIKYAFATELETTQGRKHLKAELEFLLNEGLIETNSKFEFLGWEMLNGLYPLDNKKIEARLAGKWQSFLSKRATGIKREPVAPPPPEEPAQPLVKSGLYDAPASVLAYPGVPLDKDETPDVNEQADQLITDTEFLPFKAGRVTIKPPVAEDNFLPFKARKAPSAAPETVNNKPVSESKTPENPPLPEDLKPFGSGTFVYTAPRADRNGTEADHQANVPPAVLGGDNKPVYSAVKLPVITTPDVPVTLPQPVPPQPEKVVRIATSVKRKAIIDEPEEPVFTVRKPAGRQQPIPDAPLANATVVPPVAESTPASKVIRLRPQAEAIIEPVPQTNHDAQHLPPPTINYAAIRFDTENNPFNSLGTIDLTAGNNTPDDAEAKPKILSPKLIRQLITGIVLAVILLVVIIYKMRY